MSALQPERESKCCPSLETDRDRKLTAVAASGGTGGCARVCGRLEGGHCNWGYDQYRWLSRPGSTSWWEDSALGPGNHQPRVGVGELIRRTRMRLCERQLLDPERWQLGSTKARIHNHKTHKYTAAWYFYIIVLLTVMTSYYFAYCSYFIILIYHTIIFFILA